MGFEVPDRVRDGGAERSGIWWQRDPGSSPGRTPTPNPIQNPPRTRSGASKPQPDPSPDPIRNLNTPTSTLTGPDPEPQHPNQHPHRTRSGASTPQPEPSPDPIRGPYPPKNKKARQTGGLFYLMSRGAYAAFASVLQILEASSRMLVAASLTMSRAPSKAVRSWSTLA